MRSGEGVWGPKTQNQAGSLVLGLPSQTAMVEGRGWWWWWCVPIDVVAVMRVAFAYLVYPPLSYLSVPSLLPSYPRALSFFLTLLTPASPASAATSTCTHAGLAADAAATASRTAAVVVGHVRAVPPLPMLPPLCCCRCRCAYAHPLASPWFVCACPALVCLLFVAFTCKIKVSIF
ncbi:hypothetical protein PILCRDRAFT_810176 [Piloderma croceum F 1598]|uniref:Uncharacterized protein n=1 Tax=Piloderma croceum (strain F 1598) TaxID=765440 RepID=A0A0C3CR92_PILCF|nr:hypothetical protein PILCRDRAFT_810176 [Piloderma croceum F 1598]